MKTLLMAAALSSCSAMPVMAGACMDMETGMRMLQEQYKETISTILSFTAGPMVGSELVMTSNPVTQTWTILRLDPSGLACMLASGEGIQRIEQTPLPEGELN